MTLLYLSIHVFSLYINSFISLPFIFSAAKPRSRHRAFSESWRFSGGLLGEKSFQKSSTINKKMIQNRGLEGVWAALGHLLGGSWAKLGSKAPPGRFLEAI